VRDLPTGTVTFLFTDIEGSTRLLQELGAEPYAAALAEHRRLLRESFARNRGIEVDTEGDAFFVAFERASDALAAAEQGQQALAPGPIRVRMGIHSGEPLLREDKYVGLDVHRAARIAAAGHGGQVLVSATTAALTGSEGLLDLGEHRFKDLSAPERVYQLGKEEFPRLKTLYQTNLPVPATPFLGREAELAEASELLLDGVRLLTLSGPGGTGKTRLALQAAAAAADGYPDGVWWVPLAPLKDPAIVLSTVGETLGVKGELPSEIEGKRMLLLLDNFEHLIDAAEAVAGLVAACPDLTVLVTSRERLQLAGEHEYAVPALAPPDGLALFAARARALGTEVDGDEAALELCERLDNLPLALELAAARTKLFSPAQLLERLGRRLDLFKGGRDADPRQRTLRATIEWSYDLLTVEEQQLFARLSVFAGGCTYEAAEEICDADEDTLQSLLDKSLLRRAESATGESRYWMLETIREYAIERLNALEERTELHRRHASHFMTLAEAEELWLRGLDEAASVRRLRLELANFRVALGTAISRTDAETALRLAGALHPYWYLEGHFIEGRTWAERALALGGTPAQREKALAAAGEFALMQGATQEARRHLEERLEICAELGDAGLLATAHTLLGHVAVVERDYPRALGFYEQALAFEEQAIGTTTVWRSRGSALNNIGFALLHLDRLDAAERTLREAVDLAGEEGTVFVQSAALNNLARVALARRDASLLRCHVLASLTLQDEPNPHILMESLELIARLCCLEHRWETAARAAGGAEHLRKSLGLGDEVEEIPGKEALAAARAETGAATWELELARGKGAAADDALRLARDCLD
jgi:predicted ATPase